MRVADYDYELPEGLIAQHPPPRRDGARLMLLDRAAGRYEHLHFPDLPNLLRQGDTLVFNDSRVLPARLLGQRRRTGGRWEGLFLRADEQGDWLLLAKTRGHPEPGERFALEGDGGELELVAKPGPGQPWRMRPTVPVNPVELLERLGHVPLPPYIRGGADVPEDRERYQTVYAAHPGSVAAPTAGLHFTPELREELARRGVALEHVTLHVGLGTFLPVKADRPEDHVMHAEWCRLDPATATRLAAAKAARRRVLAVGTTACRVLETAAAQPDGAGIRPYEGETRLFLHPPHEFRAVDGLLTNFHLPRTTLLMLVAALAGWPLVRRAYLAAVREEYRFFSYGDAMLIV